MKNNIELLSPAGNIESFKAACSSGADAIYMGLSKFNARVMAENFDEDMYIECIKYAHMRGIKVYLTLNTILFDNEIKDALNLVLKLYSHGLDAVIVQDIGIANLIKKMIPNISLHASTQMSVHSLEQLKYLEKIGFNRVVLARELTVDEIKYICKNTDLEIEVFVHGALCVSVSGQCLLSSQIGSRSANRGSCAQPCRMKYRLYNKSTKKILSKNTYILSKKDIYGLEMLNKLADAGVHSFKIEGRNKTPEYVSLVTSIYKKYLDNVKNGLDINVLEDDKRELIQIFNRNGLSTGYLNGVEYKDSITQMSPKNTGIYLGEILDQNKLFIKVKLEEEIDMHDGIEIYSGEDIFSTIVTCIKNDKNKIVNSKEIKGETVWIGDISKNLDIGSKIYKTSSNELNEKYRKLYIDKKNQNRRNIDICIYAKKDKKIEASFKKDENNNIEVSIDYIPEIAKNKATSIEQIIEAFSKTEDTAFEFNNANIELDDNLFIPVSKLNELRRTLVEAIEKSFEVNIDVNEIENNMDKLLNEIKIIDKIFKNSSSRNSLFVYEYSNDFDYIKFYKEKYLKKLDVMYINVTSFIKSKEEIISKYKDKTNIYVYIPNLVFNNLSKIITTDFLEDLIKSGIKGFLVGNVGYIDTLVDLKEKYNVELVADYSLNISNTYSAVFLKNQGFDYITLSVEMDRDMLKEISKDINIEVADDYITVMSSRYCIIGSFVSNREKGKKCSMDCTKSKYMLKDSYNEDYNLIFNNIDCTMSIVKKYESRQKIDGNISIRNTII